MKTKSGVMTANHPFHFSCCILSVLFLMTLQAAVYGAMTISVVETSTGVTITASGSVNLSGLEREGETFNSNPNIEPIEGIFSLGAATTGSLVDVGDTYRARNGEIITHPVTLGGGGFTAASFGAGPFFGFVIFGGAAPDLLRVPNDYSSGSQFTTSATFLGATITSLGLRPGQYVWSWGSGASADSMTMTIPQAGTGSSAQNIALMEKIRKFNKKLKAAKRKNQTARVKRFQKKIRVLKAMLGKP